MKLRTVSNLLNAMDEEFAWRFKEIADVKVQARKAEGTRRQTAIRSGVPLLYAHWEGFVKGAAQLWINFVAHQPVTYRRLAPCFIVRSLRAELASLGDAGNWERTSNGIAQLLANLDNDARLSPKSPVQTASNLSSRRFTELAFSIGFDPMPYLAKANLIDISLVDRRNTIAHGEFLEVDEAAFQDLCDEVPVLLRQFKTDVENAAVLKSYQTTAA